MKTMKNFKLLFAAVALLGFAACSSSDDASTETPWSYNDEQAPIKDTKAPYLYILSPTSESAFVTTDAGLVISGTAQDDRSISSVTYTTSYGAKGTATGLDSWSITDLNLPEGDSKITVMATDIGGNKSTASIIITKNKYLSFVGIPTMDKDMVYCNSSTPIWIKANISPNEHLVASSVKVIEVDANNQYIADVCTLYDDGNLTDHSDEIKGDNVFSIRFPFIFTEDGTKRFRISAQTQENEGLVTGLSSVFTLVAVNREEAEQEVDNLMNTQHQVKAQIAEMQNMDEAVVAEQLTTILEADPNVKKVEKEEGLLKISHKSGLESYVVLKESASMKGFGNDDSKNRSKTAVVPLARQTRGTFKPMFRMPSYTTRAAADLDENIISNKRVLVWSAFADKCDINMASELKDIFEQSPVKLKVDYMTNLECSKASIQNFSNYGIIVIDTHGWNGDIIFTRDMINESLESLSEDEIYNLFSSAVKMFTMRDGNTYAALTSKFIKNLIKDKFPNSIIFNGSCESLKNDQLAEAFISKGAKTYVGFSGNISTQTCTEKAKQFFSALVGNQLKTTGESFVADENFHEPDGSVSSYLMRGSKDMHFYLGLINGNFEYGNLHGWEVDGDGRIISQLVNILPTEGNYMGIISTGLGYTEKYGSIRQTFRINQESVLTLKWNYLSEEFMEYVGSIYQDFLKISIINENGETNQLFYMAIDDFAKVYENKLISVSPDIVFDKGGIYKTDWQYSSFDISQYQGQTVTLVLEAGDVGDSIYDSAVLLDEISVQ